MKKNRSEYLQVYRFDNPEKMYDQRLRDKKKRETVEFKEKRRAAYQKKRQEILSKRIIIEPLE